MDLTKANCRKIKLKDRRFKPFVFKGNELTTAYICELDSYNDIQIIRFFKATKDYCLELQRVFLKNGSYLLMSLASSFNNRSYKYNLILDSKFDFREKRNVAIYVHKIVNRNTLPEFKKYICTELTKIDIVDWFCLVSSQKNNTNFESLASINLKQLIRIYKSIYTNQDLIKKINKYIRCFQLINKWKYKIKDMRSYLDHLDLVSKFNLDLRSPKYIAPANFKKAHEELVEKNKKQIITKEMELKYREKLLKYKVLNVVISFGDDFLIKPLQTIKQVKLEGQEQHHCVFSNEYYSKDNVLLFTSFKGERKLETIEYNIDNHCVVQSRGKYNKLTEYHDYIVKSGSCLITNYLIENGIRL